MHFPDFRKLAAGGLAVTVATIGGTTAALAHWGHLGEMAGHGHLTGVALGVVVALAAAFTVKGKDQTQIAEDDDSTEPGPNDEGELAHA